MCRKIIALGSPKHNIKLSHSALSRRNWLAFVVFWFRGWLRHKFRHLKTLNSEIWRREAHCSPISTLFWSESIKLFTIYEVRINHKACAMTSWLLTARSCNRRSDEICALKSVDSPTPSRSGVDTCIVQFIVHFCTCCQCPRVSRSIQVFVLHQEKVCEINYRLINDPDCFQTL